jgi:hypothetical protein
MTTIHQLINMLEGISLKPKCEIKIHLVEIHFTYGNYFNEITHINILKMWEWTTTSISIRQDNQNITWTSQSWSKFVVTWAIIVESSVIFINKGRYSSSTCFSGLNIVICQIFMLCNSLFLFVSIIWANLINFNWCLRYLQKKK